MTCIVDRLRFLRPVSKSQNTALLTGYGSPGRSTNRTAVRIPWPKGVQLQKPKGQRYHQMTMSLPKFINNHRKMLNLILEKAEDEHSHATKTSKRSQKHHTMQGMPRLHRPG